MPSQTKASLIVPPEPDALALLIRRSLLETRAPDEPAATTQSIPATPPAWRPGSREHCEPAPWGVPVAPATVQT